MQRRGFDFFRKLSNPSSDNFAQLTESISLFLLQVKIKKQNLHHVRENAKQD